MPPNNDRIRSLLPRNHKGSQFVIYADSCSGVAGAPHEATFAAVNSVVAKLDPQPEFICFPGDEIIGLTADEDVLRRQWAHWFDVEMAWLDQTAIPLYHTTGNHTVYDAASQAIYQSIMDHLPCNGPPHQEKLTYFVRRGDLLLVFVNTLCAELGGEGFVELDWLGQTLADHSDAKQKLVFGHHPIFPVNGFVGEHARNVDSDVGKRLWALLVKHGVLAYICSHILAFDVQVHNGVLQILSAGAGTAHRMPEGTEYLHCVQAALDDDGLRYQVVDTDGIVREWLQWPLPDLKSPRWRLLANGITDAPFRGSGLDTQTAQLLSYRFSGICPSVADGTRQTLLSAWNGDLELSPLWIGLVGCDNQIIVSMAPTTGRSPHLWHGPQLEAEESFVFQLTIHDGMGPGGLLWRRNEEEPWSSMDGTAAWGAERLTWPEFWSVGHGQRGEVDAPFRGRALSVSWSSQLTSLS